jgi:sec-independent protein translocase protein TatA
MHFTVAPLMAFSWPSGPDLLIIAILALVLFGSKKLPMFGDSLRRSMGEFRRAKEDFEEQAYDASRRHHDPQPEPSLALYYFIFALSLVILLWAILQRLGH